jgi:sugar phosphate isomerase/epimerase
MKTAIDSYCYHRFFGEVYPQQSTPANGMTLEDFLHRAHQLEVGGVSLESCFVPRLDTDYLSRVRALLDEYCLERVFAWGHPDGLEGGTNQNAYSEMIRCFEFARGIGAKVMRVVGSSLRFRNQPHGPQIERLSRMFREAVKVAEEYGIRMAVENHIDFTADEMLRLLTDVNSPWLGINFDTGNFLRLLDDPIKGMVKLAPFVYATHIKDLKVQKGVPADEWYFFSCTPVGDGLVDNSRLVQLLADAGYHGLLAVEIDFLHRDYDNNEDQVVARSVTELKRLTDSAKTKRPLSNTRTGGENL